MKITNVHNLPIPLFEALVHDPYERVGDISITGLIRPPLMRQLELRFPDQIVEDAADRIYRLLGQSVHAVIERHGQHNRLAEERLVSEINGWQVSGKPDLLDGEETDEGPQFVLTDYKVTSVYAFLLGDKPEWDAQLNGYAWLYRRHNFSPDRLQIVAMLRDWMKRRADTEAGYPPAGAFVQPIELWQDDAATRYLFERVSLHQAAEGLDVKDIPLCTPEERWEKPTTWAVKKRGNKRALPGGIHETPAAAEAFAASSAHACEIEERRGECVRCAHYCAAAAVCPFGQAIKKLSEGNQPTEEVA